MSFTFDLAHLSVFSPAEVNAESIEPEKLKESARDAFIAFWAELSNLDHENQSRVKLPKPTIKLPREKPIPLEKPKTRWEQFAERKGIEKDKNREKKVFDKVTGEYKLRYGYKRANDPLDKWCIEVPNTDKSEDPFLKMEKDKKERVAEQKKREIRNKKRAARSLAEQAVTASIKGSKKKDNIEKALKAASHPTSSASMNQFNKVQNKVGIFENGSSVPKIFDRTKGQKPKKGKR